MMYLDTSIGIVNGRSSHRLGEQMRAGAPIALPVIALFEMRIWRTKARRSAIMTI
jgi:hypothetical protein